MAALKVKARLTDRLRVLGHPHEDGGPSVAEQIGMLDLIVAQAEARYEEFNPTRVQQLRDHVGVVESFLEALYTESPYVPLSQFAEDDPRRLEQEVKHAEGYEGWRRLRHG